MHHPPQLPVVVDITVVFNATTKSLIVTTAPWTSTWSYDPDFNVLFGTTRTDSTSSGDGFPLAAAAGAAVGGKLTTSMTLPSHR
jgi:hypothetical protein